MTPLPLNPGLSLQAGGGECQAQGRLLLVCLRLSVRDEVSLPPPLPQPCAEGSGPAHAQEGVLAEKAALLLHMRDSTSSVYAGLQLQLSSVDGLQPATGLRHLVTSPSASVDAGIVLRAVPNNTEGSSVVRETRRIWRGICCPTGSVHLKESFLLENSKSFKGSDSESGCPGHVASGQRQTRRPETTKNK